MRKLRLSEVADCVKTQILISLPLLFPHHYLYCSTIKHGCKFGMHIKMLLMNFHTKEVESVEQQRVKGNGSIYFSEFILPFFFSPLHLILIAFAARVIWFYVVCKSLFNPTHQRYTEGFTTGVVRVSDTS